MRKAIIAVVVVLIIVGAWLIFAGNKKTTNNQTNTGSSPASSSQTNQPSPPVAATDKVTIQNFAFSPDAITVKKGTKVTWTNQDSTSHTVTENDGKNGPSAPPLSQGQNYGFTFNEAGTFHYHCSIHPEITGTVTVTD